MDFQLYKVPLAENQVLRNLMQLYQYDFSALDGDEVNALGLFDYLYLDHYWTESDRHPFLIRKNENIAGFVLVNTHSVLEGGWEGRNIAEFFILRKYRRQGLGRQVACRLFDRFPGKWEVNIQANNPLALQFWESVITGYTEGACERMEMSEERWTGWVYRFSSS